MLFQTKHNYDIIGVQNERQLSRGWRLRLAENNAQLKRFLSGAVCVTTPDMYKRAALLFEKVCFPVKYFENVLHKPTLIPPSIALDLPAGGGRSVLIEMLFGEQDWFELNNSSDEYFARFRSKIASIITQAKKVETVLLYPTGSAFNDEFSPGRNTAYQAIITNIQLVDESNLEWEQVLEFRNDKDSLWKYRKLRNWLQDSLEGKSETQATDSIAQKVEDYGRAIHKHGLETKIGALTSVIDPKGIIAVGSGTIFAKLAAGPVWAAITTGALLLGKVGINVVRQAIDLRDIKRGEHSEIALIYDINKNFG